MSARAARQGRWWRLCQKELRETLRDRRTLTTLILMPLLVYPILSMVFQRSMLTGATQQPQAVIGVLSQQDAIQLRDQLALAEHYLEQEATFAQTLQEDEVLPASGAEVRGRPGEDRRDEDRKDQGDPDGDGVDQRASASHGSEVAESDVENKSTSDETSDASLPSASSPSESSPDESSRDHSASDRESKTENLLQAFTPPEMASGGMAGSKLRLDMVTFREVPDLEQAVRDERIDLAVSFTRTGHVQLTYREASALSARALEFMEERLRALNEIDLRQRLVMARRRSGISVRVFRHPLVVKSSGTATLATIVPMILILMTVTGAVYPAIDLTAGERERGTLEMLMASPVPRFRLLLAKYAAVVLVAFLTALVNLAAMTITLWATGLSKALLGEAGIGLTRIVQILALLVLFAAFFSAVLLSLTSFARSFKEAQAYLIPLMLLSLGPGIVSLMPGLELNGLLAITPVSNIVLLARDLCGDAVNGAMACVAIVSTALYTLAALAVAARIFGADAVLSGPNASFQTLFREAADGGPLPEHRVATVGGAMFCLAVLFPAYFVVLNSLAQLGNNLEFPMGLRLALSGLGTSILFGGIPWFNARLQRLDLQSAFQVFAAPLPAFTVALMLGFTVWPIAHEAVLLMQWIEFAPLSEQHLQRGAAYLAEFQTVPLALILATVAVAPAVFEELFFRGYLFSALKAATNKRTTILVSSGLFGIFHVVSSNALSMERLLPSTLMGLLLGWLCYHSRSVLPGILLHACHNGTLMMMAYYKDELAERGFGLKEQEHIPPVFLGACVFGLLIGLWLIHRLPADRHVRMHEQ